jgi:hypothetical protein
MEFNKRKTRVQRVFLNGTELVKHFKLLFASSTPKIVYEVFEMEANGKGKNKTKTTTNQYFCYK